MQAGAVIPFIDVLPPELVALAIEQLDDEHLPFALAALQGLLLVGAGMCDGDDGRPAAVYVMFEGGESFDRLVVWAD